MVIIRYEAPQLWWSRGINLLRSLPEARVTTRADNPDMIILVSKRGRGLLISGTYGVLREQAIVPANTREYQRALFTLITRLMDKPPSPWGILTGIRPGKVAAELLARDPSQAVAVLEGEYLISPAKAGLLVSTCTNAKLVPRGRGLSIYVSVPFCPSRCHYCSFPGHTLERWRHILNRYIDQSARELGDLIRACAQKQLPINSIYVGGGTPTSLNPEQLRTLLAPAQHPGCEFTVEAGRPDTLTAEHISVLETLGVTRLGVNCQYPDQQTLDMIGRGHSLEQFYHALKLALDSRINCINSDLIIGLPGQQSATFINALAELVMAGVQNITLHALALKRGAKLTSQSLAPEQAAAIAEQAYEFLNQAGYQPYYLYRQKQIVGNLENVGFSLPGYYCYYNIVSIGETEPVLGVGAGAVSKLVRHNSIETLSNPQDPMQYLKRSDSLARRKLDWLRHSS